MSEWISPTYPEKGPCRIRKKPHGLASAGWRIIGWLTPTRLQVAFGATRETMELPLALVEVPGGTREGN